MEAMKKPVTLNVQQGFETWSGSSFELRVFLAKSPGMAYAEQHLNQAARDAQNPLVRTLGSPTRHLPAPNRDASMGEWWTASYELEEGTLVKLVTNQSAPRFGDRRKAIQKFFRLRREAPLWHVGMALPEKVGRTIEEAHLYARMDPLTLDEALGLGAVVVPRFRHLFVDTFGDALTMRMVEPALSDMVMPTTKTILDAEGEATVIRTSRRGRAVR